MGKHSSSSWISTRLFLIGLCIAVVSTFFILETLLSLYSYYTWTVPNGGDWCYGCPGLASRLGPELSMVILGMCSIGLGSGIIILFLVRQRQYTHEKYLLILRKKSPILILFAGVAIGATVGVYLYKGFSLYGEISASVYGERTIQLMSSSDPEILEGAAAIDEATLNQTPKLKQVMDEAYKRMDMKGISRTSSSKITLFEVNSISSISKKDSVASHIPGEILSFNVKYDGLYYHILIQR